jgi:hypothetical protein
MPADDGEEQCLWHKAVARSPPFSAFPFPLIPSCAPRRRRVSAPVNDGAGDGEER